MNTITRLTCTAAVAAAGVAAFTVPANAASSYPDSVSRPNEHALFVQTDDPLAITSSRISEGPTAASASISLTPPGESAAFWPAR
jgi:hypothetical protein